VLSVEFGTQAKRGVTAWAFKASKISDETTANVWLALFLKGFMFDLPCWLPADPFRC
jgi:hypothetical protein